EVVAAQSEGHGVAVAGGRVRNARDIVNLRIGKYRGVELGGFPRFLVEPQVGHDLLLGRRHDVFLVAGPFNPTASSGAWRRRTALLFGVPSIVLDPAVKPRDDNLQPPRQAHSTPPSQREARPLRLAVGHADVAIVPLQDAAGDGQAEAVAAAAFVAAGVEAGEGFEDGFELVRRDAGAVVTDADFHLVLGDLGVDG